MTNYKPFHDSSSFGGFNFSLPPTATRKLFSFHGIVSTTGTSWHDTTDGVVYTVPTGKKYIPIGMKIAAEVNIYRVITLFYADNLNGTTNKVDLALVHLYTRWSSSYIDIPFPNLANPSAPAGKYINCTTDNATNTQTPTLLLGYEEDI